MPGTSPAHRGTATGARYGGAGTLLLATPTLLLATSSATRSARAQPRADLELAGVTPYPPARRSRKERRCRGPRPAPAPCADVVRRGPGSRLQRLGPDARAAANCQ